jgi:hypothetical protein
VDFGTIIVTSSAVEDLSRSRARNGSTTPSPSIWLDENPIACWDILGPSILSRMTERLRRHHGRLITVVAGSKNDGQSSSGAWEKVAVDYARSGVERILVIELGTYTEVDVDELLRCHNQKRSPITEVLSDQERVGMTLIEAKHLTRNASSLASQLPAFLACSSSYEYTGYSCRLAYPADYRRLVRSALTGQCGIKPMGKEIQPGVWVAPDTRVPGSVRLVGPCYIGSRVRVRSGASIETGSSIEQECEVDCGTTLSDSTVLPGTYIGPGLNVSESVVDGGRLVHLGHDFEIEVNGTGLFGCTTNRVAQRFLNTLSTFVAPGANTDLGVPTSSRTSASFDYVRNWFVD